MKITSSPSRSTPLKLTTKPNQSRPARFSPPAPRAASVSARNVSSSSWSSFKPDERRIALRSLCSPKTSSNMPTISSSRVFGNHRVSAYPATPAVTARIATAAAVPARAERHPRVRPIARTIVNASTNSTVEARSVAAKSPTILQVICALPCRDDGYRQRPLRVAIRDQPGAAPVRREARQPADHDDEPVLEADEVPEVDGQPGQPGGKAAQLESLDVGDRGGAADRREVALVVVAEGRCGDAEEAILDDERGITALLHRHRRH